MSEQIRGRQGLLVETSVRHVIRGEYFYEDTYRPATTAEIMEAYYDIRNAESPVIWMPKVEIEQDIDDGLYWLRVNDSPFIHFTNKEQAERMKNLLIHQLISHKAEP